MAKATFSLPDDFIDKLSRLAERTDEIVPRVLEAGGEVVLEQVRQNLQSVVGRDTKYPSRSTGELASALGISPVKVDRNGNFNVKIGFDDPRSGDTSNVMIASIIEYGKHGQPPKPFMKPAMSMAKFASIEIMKQKFATEVDGL